MALIVEKGRTWAHVEVGRLTLNVGWFPAQFPVLFECSVMEVLYGWTVVCLKVKVLKFVGSVLVDLRR